MPASDLSLLTEAAEEAGRIAKRHWGGAPRVWHKDDKSPVTEADLEIDRMLRAELLAARPDYGWLSEETADDGLRLGRSRAFIVDPIDGTRAFLAGEKTFCHALAVVEDGRAVAAVVHLPMMGRTYSAQAGGGARLGNKTLFLPETVESAKTPTVLANAHALDPEHWPGGVPDVRRSFRPSLAYRLCLVAEGRFDATLTVRPAWEWDVAAGALIAAEAGARVSDRFGAVLSFNNPAPQVPGLVAAAPDVHAAFLARLAGAARP